jgi:hypothetical protein
MAMVDAMERRGEERRGRGRREGRERQERQEAEDEDEGRREGGEELADVGDRRWRGALYCSSGVRVVS